MLRTEAGPRRPRAALLAVSMVLLASGCGQPVAGDDERPRVVATISIIADFAEAVAGDDVRVTSLVGVGVDPHVYEPTPGDARLIADADLVLANGLGLEGWLGRLVSPRARSLVVLGDALEAAVVSDEEGDPDPHLWMDPVYATGYVEGIAEAIAELDPGNAGAYRARAAAYVRELVELDEWIAARVAEIPPERRLLVATHDAFRYFGERYGITVVGTIWGVSTETEPSPEELAALVDAVREHGVPTVFAETTVNPRLMERVARDAGVAVGEPLHGDSVGAPGSGADTYLDMQRANTDAIVAGLSGSAP